MLQSPKASWVETSAERKGPFFLKIQHLQTRHSLSIFGARYPAGTAAALRWHRGLQRSARASPEAPPFPQTCALGRGGGVASRAAVTSHSGRRRPRVPPRWRHPAPSAGRGRRRRARALRRGRGGGIWRCLCPPWLPGSPSRPRPGRMACSARGWPEPSSFSSTWPGSSASTSRTSTSSPPWCSTCGCRWAAGRAGSAVWREPCGGPAAGPGLRGAAVYVPWLLETSHRRAAWFGRDPQGSLNPPPGSSQGPQTLCLTAGSQRSWAPAVWAVPAALRAAPCPEPRLTFLSAVPRSSVIVNVNASPTHTSWRVIEQFPASISQNREQLEQKTQG